MMPRICLGAGLTVLLLACTWLALPQPDLYAGHRFSSAWLDRDGGLLRLGLAADDRYRLRLTSSEIAPVMGAATLLYEDRYFYRHPGINPVALAEAAWTSYITGGRRRGASTITMQLARLRWRLDTQDLSGKFLQILRALQIERHFSKAEILNAYLNLAPYGGNIEGVGAASWLYFGKPAAALTQSEALALAVIPQNPVARDPLTRSGRRALQQASGRLAALWNARYPGDTGPAELQLAFDSRAQPTFAAPHFVDGLNPSSESGEVTTTLAPGFQWILEDHIQNYVRRRASAGIENAAAILIDNRDMSVLASVGSADFFNDRIHGQVDGTRARRSPGSALKPFVYALAMDQGLIHPMTLMKDAPTRFGAYTPENYDRQFTGPVFAKDALTLSRNVPAVSLTAQLADPGLYGLLKDAGVTHLRKPEHYGLALALGGAEVSMRELAGLYAMLANLGQFQPLREYQTADRPQGKRLLSPEAAFLTLEMLRDNPPPQGKPAPGARGRSFDVYWKTGTSYAFRDAWSAGIFGPYTLVVWVGRFDGRGNPAYVGRQAAGPLFFEIADAVAGATENFTPRRIWPNGINVAKVDVCGATGDLATGLCPHTSESWFIPGVSPIRVSRIYRSIPVLEASGRRACRYRPGKTRMQVFEFWPSDMLKLFRQAGIPRQTPPPFGEPCNLASQGGLAPQIQSPSGELEYALRTQDMRIPFNAISDSDAQQLFWFVDNRYVGSAAPGQTLMWSASPGSYEVRVVDDQGRAAQIKLQVWFAS